VGIRQGGVLVALADVGGGAGAGGLTEGEFKDMMAQLRGEFEQLAGD